MLSHDQVEAFRRLYLDAFNEELSEAEARCHVVELLDLYLLALGRHPIQREKQAVEKPLG